MTKYLHGMMRMEARGGGVVMTKEKIRIPKEMLTSAQISFKEAKKILRKRTTPKNVLVNEKRYGMLDSMGMR